jgi:pSer/pThr/pTyr-binding forkhead associated (FHA) protein
MWILQTDSAGAEGPQTFRLSSGAVKTLGRATRADFILEAALVSRLHCRLTATPSGELVVEDLRSTNGTFVNGQRVTAQPLSAGDRLRVGRVELTVQCQAGAR